MSIDKTGSGIPSVNVQRRTTKVNFGIIAAVIIFFLIAGGVVLWFGKHSSTPPPSGPTENR
jgi:hypothetical protein